MAKFSLRKYETQAQVSMVLALASVIPLVGLIGVILRAMIKNHGWSEKVIYYGGPTKAAVYGGTAMALLLAGVAFGLGVNSAGQRRNDRQRASWVGFFVSAVVLALTVVLIALFMMRGEAVVA